MKGYLITVGTVTYALKGRDILRKQGFKADIERISSGENNLGCGYSIAVSGDINRVRELLLSNGIRILKVNHN